MHKPTLVHAHVPFNPYPGARQDNDRLTGFSHNAVTPIGMSERLPVILSDRIARLAPPMFWMGGGEVDLKLGLDLQARWRFMGLHVNAGGRSISSQVTPRVACVCCAGAPGNTPATPHGMCPACMLCYTPFSLVVRALLPSPRTHHPRSLWRRTGPPSQTSRTTRRTQRAPTWTTNELFHQLARAGRLVRDAMHAE